MTDLGFTLPLSENALLTALARGQGRALMHVRHTGRLLSTASMLDHLLVSQSYDQQCEGHRATWLFEIMQAVGWTERFVRPVCDAIHTTEDTWDLAQLCALALLYARAGHPEAATALRWVVDTCPDKSAPWQAQSEILEFDGVEGFVRIARHYLAAGLESGPYDWRDLDWLHTQAKQTLGEAEVLAALAEIPALKGLSGLIEAAEAERSKLRPAPHWEPAEVNVEALVTAARQSTQPMIGWFMFWGNRATSAQLEQVVSTMITTSELTVRWHLWQVFRHRALPSAAPEILIDQVLACEDSWARSRGISMLSRSSDPRMRVRAREALARSDLELLPWLTHDRTPEDTQAICAALRQAPTDDPDFVHSVGLDLLAVFGADATGCAEAMIWLWSATPCSVCRGQALEQLQAAGGAPAWLVEEAASDSNLDIRELVAITS
ncbi:hypothetical protein [Enhygromyxa salina]|uniref:Uncharacterized protein n=1 Tax=Enhygromyxa salina TaxID=215803 RepID=A0A2S9YUI0_9BACT|nr:hypothetical protein [Enhygromyxa salina]PRQ08765.1 hypothetical protein ENSA7_13970 [Enhygromyxa salina]